MLLLLAEAPSSCAMVLAPPHRRRRQCPSPRPCPGSAPRAGAPVCGSTGEVLAGPNASPSLPPLPPPGRPPDTTNQPPASAVPRCSRSRNRNSKHAEASSRPRGSGRQAADAGLLLYLARDPPLAAPPAAPPRALLLRRHLGRPTLLVHRCRRGPLPGVLVRPQRCRLPGPRPGHLRRRLALAPRAPHPLARRLPPFPPYLPPPIAIALAAVDRRIHAAVPAVSDHLRHAQEAFISAEVAGVADVEAFLEGVKGVALEANRLRRGVLSELVAAAGGYQAALFLEALSRFVLSMHDSEVLRRFDQCRASPGIFGIHEMG